MCQKETLLLPCFPIWQNHFLLRLQWVQQPPAKKSLSLVWCITHNLALGPLIERHSPSLLILPFPPIFLLGHCARLSGGRMAQSVTVRVGAEVKGLPYYRHCCRFGFKVAWLVLRQLHYSRNLMFFGMSLFMNLALSGTICPAVCHKTADRPLMKIQAIFSQPRTIFSATFCPFIQTSRALF